MTREDWASIILILGLALAAMFLNGWYAIGGMVIWAGLSLTGKK